MTQKSGIKPATSVRAFGTGPSLHPYLCWPVSARDYASSAIQASTCSHRAVAHARTHMHPARFLEPGLLLGAMRSHSLEHVFWDSSVLGWHKYTSMYMHTAL
jgi:hypothetical protein